MFKLEAGTKKVYTSSENLQASELILRDSDMGFELVAYHKNNIIVQSAQAEAERSIKSASVEKYEYFFKKY